MDAKGPQNTECETIYITWQSKPILLEKWWKNNNKQLKFITDNHWITGSWLGTGKLRVSHTCMHRSLILASWGTSRHVFKIPNKCFNTMLVKNQSLIMTSWYDIPTVYMYQLHQTICSNVENFLSNIYIVATFLCIIRKNWYSKISHGSIRLFNPMGIYMHDMCFNIPVYCKPLHKNPREWEKILI